MAIDTTKGIAGLKGALRYVRAYRDQVFVVKLGGEVLSEPDILDSVTGQLALLSSLQDVTIRTYFMLTPDVFQTDLLQMINDRLAPSVAFRAFVITGQQHTLLGTMTTSTTNGSVLEPWLDQMINDQRGWDTVLPQ